mmetsp:Transcript_9778/g.24577  ORF Transcript_9778/g.24577 Transcript_9778/m.24577 type:complete len:81 (+) Transcript_9778:596-838(+)
MEARAAERRREPREGIFESECFELPGVGARAVIEIARERRKEGFARDTQVGGSGVVPAASEDGGGGRDSGRDEGGKTTCG